MIKNNMQIIVTAILILACIALLICIDYAQRTREVAPNFRKDIEHVIIIAVDTLRVDQLGFMGCPRNTSTFIDRLAERSVVFEEAYTPRSLTLPSFTALFTGMHPIKSGVMENGETWPPNLHSLVEDFKDSGFRTIGIPAVNVIKSDRGINAGFDFYLDLEHGVSELNADQVIKSAMAAMNIERDAHEPLFLFMHFFDPHTPYLPKPEFTAAFSNYKYSGPMDGSQDIIDKYNLAEIDLSPEDLYQGRALYNGEILELDSKLGVFFEWLEGEGYMDNSLIVFMADHGESLGEYGAFSHGQPNEQELHIPLFFHFPHDAGAGRRIKGLTEITDIMPTIMEIVGIPVPDGINGIGHLTKLQFNVDRGRPYVLGIGGRRSDGLPDFSVWDGEWRMEPDVIDDEIMWLEKQEMTPEQREVLESLGYVN